MPREPFKTDYTPGEPHVLEGDLINREHDVLNAVTGERPASHSESIHHRGSIRGETHPAPTLVGVAKITDAADTCSQTDAQILESVAAPCSSQNLYLARFRFYNWDNTSWEEYDEDLPLDAGAYFESDPTDASKTPVTAGISAGGIPAYVKGDVVPCYWDNVRGALVPIHSPYQDVVQVEAITKTTQTVPLIPAWNRGARDSFCEAYLEIKRPTDGDWRPLSALSWRLPYLDQLRDWNDTRTGFAMFAAPHNTLVRLRAAQSSDMTIETNWSQMLFWGAGRKSADADFVPHQVGTRAGGTVITGWTLRADVVGRFKDSPVFNLAPGSGVTRITYTDPLDSWIIGLEYTMKIKNRILKNVQDVCVTLVTSITCANETIQQYCTRQICFPAEVGNRMTIGQESCVDCQTSSSSSSAQ